VQSAGIEVADFLAVRPEHRGDDDGAFGKYFRSSSDFSASLIACKLAL
jgi:hypothetical protein